MCPKQKKKTLSLTVFNMIKETNESKTLTRQISCECKCKFDNRKWNSNQNSNDDKYWWECKNLKEHRVYENICIWNSM